MDKKSDKYTIGTDSKNSSGSPTTEQSEKIIEDSTKMRKELNMSLKNKVDMEEDRQEERLGTNDATRRSMAVQVMMRDSHGTVETDNWGIVTNAGTFDKDGKPIKGGMYDPEIFDIREEEFSLQESCGPYSMYKNPEDVVGQMGIMKLALPVSDPNCPSEFNEEFWVHLTAIPVLPIAFRGMSCDKKYISKEARAWNKLAELNFAIPKLLEENPDKKEELQSQLQEAVNAVYEPYGNNYIPKDHFDLYLFVSRALRPISLEEDYETMIEKIKAIDTAIQMFGSIGEIEDFSMALRALCRYCTIVGYDTKEVNKYNELAKYYLAEIEELGF